MTFTKHLAQCVFQCVILKDSLTYDFSILLTLNGFIKSNGIRNFFFFLTVLTHSRYTLRKPVSKIVKGDLGHWQLPGQRFQV